jgi:hypothetical protein
MGFRYLWIDRYCIASDDNDAKHHQIANMDRIYRNAELTIIASSGKDASHGLPGIGRARSKQPRGAGMISTLADPERLIKASVWHTRGWTMQEALLSRRRLYFTDQQAYYECGDLCRQETVRLSTISPMSDLVVGRSPLFPIVQDNVLVPGDIEVYSQRKLTYESDILNGFLGIFKAYSKINPPLRHLWGIPILPRDLSGHALRESFLAGLCWTLIVPSRRRSGFPSWCWTGWHSAIKFRPLPNPCDDYKIRLKTTDGKLIDWDEAQDLIAQGDSRDLSTTIGLEAWTFQMRFRHQDGEFYIDGDWASQPLVNTVHWDGSPAKIPAIVNQLSRTRLELDQSVNKQDLLHERLRKDNWTCLVLGRDGGAPHKALIIDTNGRIAQRVGFLDFTYVHERNPLKDRLELILPETRRKIDLE